MDELIRVVQLPVIEEQLVAMKEQVDELVNDVLALVCTEDTLQQVKAARANLNRQFSDLEEKRKSVKAAVLGPYNRFEAIYKECVSDAFKHADKALKGKIDAVENEMKSRCEETLRSYFNELCAAEHIDFLQYERLGLTIDMASARQKEPRKLMEQVAAYVVGVSQSVNLISDMDCADEIMAEFKQCLNAPKAIATVMDRHRRVEEEAKRSAERAAALRAENEAVQKVEEAAPLAPPVQVQERDEKVYVCRFTVRATKDKLRKLKDFMIQEGIIYE